MENSHISWTHHTFNPWRGCTKISAGCDHCYAELMSGRNPKVLGEWGKEGIRIIGSEAYWQHPVKWNKAAEAAGERRRVFCASLADVFEGQDTMPEASWKPVEAARWRLWQLIEATPNLDWLLLTKRPEKIMNGEVRMPREWIGWHFPKNVWIGTSVEDQAAADTRIPHLLQVPAKVRFLSCEPLLGQLDLASINIGELNVNPMLRLSRFAPHIHWVIVGGESGPKARPLSPVWVRLLRNQCLDAGAAFHFKQWGEYYPLRPGEDWKEIAKASRRTNIEFAPVALSGEPFPYEGGGIMYAKVGKEASGRLLDGREWLEFPQIGAKS